MNEAGKTSLLVTTPSDTQIVMTREFDAPRALVFEAFTKPEHITRWLGRMGDTISVCEVDLRPGGKWRFVFALREGGEMGMYGEYLEVDPPKRIVQTEHFEGEFFEVMGAGTVNTLTLEEHEGKTLMTQTIACKSRQARDSILQTGMEGGANESMQRLADLLQKLK